MCVFPKRPGCLLSYGYCMMQSQLVDMTVDEMRLGLAYLANLLLSEGTDGGAMSLLRKLHLQFTHHQLILFLLSFVSQGYRV